MKQNQLTKMGQSVQQKRTKSRSNSQPPDCEDHFLIPGEKYPVKQDNRTQNCVYPLDGVVDMTARQGTKLHETQSTSKVKIER